MVEFKNESKVRDLMVSCPQDVLAWMVDSLTQDQADAFWAAFVPDAQPESIPAKVTRIREELADVKGAEETLAALDKLEQGAQVEAAARAAAAQEVVTP